MAGRSVEKLGIRSGNREQRRCRRRLAEPASVPQLRDHGRRHQFVLQPVFEDGLLHHFADCYYDHRQELRSGWLVRSRLFHDHVPQAT